MSDSKPQSVYATPKTCAFLSVGDAAYYPGILVLNLHKGIDRTQKAYFALGSYEILLQGTKSSTLTA
ncbi:MAG: hypothetical protein RM368_03390 [Nostoc sp. DedSLP03]|nr:hypothetical protein [Nostoc sp. DedSLP03]